MIISLEEVKEYCSIDFDDDDTLLTTFIKASEETLKSQTGRNSFESDIDLAKVYCLAFVKQLYDNRGLSVEVVKQDTKEKLKYTMKTILLILATNEVV